MTAERIIGVALALFAAILGLVRSKRSAAFDLAVTLKLQQRETPAISTVSRAASWPGFPPQSRLIPAAIIAGWWLRRGRRPAAFQLLAWGGALVSTVVKAAMRRPRPLPPAVRVVIAPLGGTSFPSGHVLTYVTFYGFLGFLLAEHLDHGPLRTASIGLLAGLLALVGPSRIQEGHHWLTDVVASYLLGLAYVLCLVQLYHATTRRGLVQSSVRTLFSR
jgi:membrane-associated phospholipid phosphatase